MKLEVGQIYLEPKTLNTRTISDMYKKQLSYYDIGGVLWGTTIRDFRSWVTKKKPILTGHYDYKKNKAEWAEEGIGTCPHSGG